MHLEVIETFEALQSVRPAWNSVYETDPEANFFLSYQWLEDWLKFSPGPWFILAVRRTPDSPDYVAFLPLRLRAKFDKKVGLYNELYMGGAPISDYTGLLCRPDMEKEAIPVLAAHIKLLLNWAQFKLEYLMMSERRRRLFFKPFDKRKFVFKPINYVQSSQIDNGVCPVADLPESWPDGWNTFLAGLSSNNRQKIRRLLKKTDSGGQCRIAIADGEDALKAIDVLMDQWTVKWTPIKGEDLAKRLAHRNRGMLRRCARNGTLLLPVFWHGDRQVAALATLIDRSRQSLHFLITGRDESFTELPAGYLLHAFSIRHAIGQGFRTYDFLRGNEPYKYHFASREIRMQAYLLNTKDGLNLRGGLDARCLDTMMDMAKELDDKGEKADAELAYQQILEVLPENALTLYRLGRLFARKGDYWAAVPWLRRSVEAEPGGDNAWRWLARSLQATGELKAALDAWSKVAEHQPDNDEAARAIAELRLAVLQSPDALKLKAPSAVPPAFAFAPPFPANVSDERSPDGLRPDGLRPDERSPDERSLGPKPFRSGSLQL